jgi:ATP-dependent DNA helicase RecQ
MLRQIALDTETTGLYPDHGHRIVEIGAVEIVDGELTGKEFHCYLNPHRAIDPGAEKVHGLTRAFLSTKPDFETIWQEFVAFIKGAELLIYNADFDLGFINQELRHLGLLDLRVETFCTRVIDVLEDARQTAQPGQKSSLEDFARRWNVDVPSGHHGALRDALLLAKTYLAFTTQHVQPAISAPRTRPSAANDIYPFLPSYALGVYRLDDDLSAFRSPTRMREFGEQKLRCLPNEIREFASGIYGTQQQDIVWDIPYLEHVPDHANRPQSYGNFFKKRAYFDNWNKKGEDGRKNSQGAENYLEIEFIKNILSRVLDDTTLLFNVIPQYPIKGYFADFRVKGAHEYVIEIDGFEKLTTSPDAFSKFLHRQNVIQDAGYLIFRFSHADITKNWEKAARTLVQAFSRDSVLRNHLHQSRRNALMGIYRQTPLPCPSDLVDLFFGAQGYFALTLLPSKVGSQQVVLRDSVGLSFPWLGLAFSSLYQWLDGIEKLFDVRFDLPSVQVFGPSSQEIPALHPKVVLLDAISDAEVTWDVSQEDIWRHLASNRLPPFEFQRRRFRSFQQSPLNAVRDAVSYFAKSIFGYTSTHVDQDKVFRRVFSGLPTLALMPTGSGKSFCYWLPALLRPGLSIVISPLNALMRDQILSLQEHGVNSAAVINSDLQGDEKTALYLDAQTGKLRILFIAPERMRIRKFREELALVIAHVPVNYLVIDEAHCVSEWGHDFRPSYLGISKFAGHLRENNPDMSMIALTATAGLEVKEDMLRVLGMNKNDIVSAKQFDRRNLSYQIIKVYGYNEKLAAYKQVLDSFLPTAMDKQDVAGILAKGEVAPSVDKGVGMVFAVYADPHGKHSWQDGVAHYLDQAQREIEKREDFSVLDDYGTGAIRGYSSKPPTHCPHCKSSYFGKIRRGTIVDDGADDIEDPDEDAELDDGTAQLVCRNCGQRFVDPKSIGRWNSIRHENQRAFKKGELDILVTTKGFGMGIDKGSVRFAIHTHMPGGIEGWYQEVGRAGRDGEHAHCVSVFDMPVPDCVTKLRDDYRHRPNCSMLHGCKIGHEWLCDYGKQHAFISASYPGQVQDTARVLRVLDDLLLGQSPGSDLIQVASSLTWQKNNELALHRLMTIGLISDYEIEYSQGRVLFHIVGFKPDIISDEVDESLKKYWQRFRKRVFLPDDLDKLEKVAGDAVARFLAGSVKRNATGFNEHQALFKRVARAIAEILEHVYKDVLKMRYDMLFNLYNMATREDCLRYQVLEYFHPEKGEIEKDYRCGFCSTCVPDVHFTNHLASEILYRDDTRATTERLEAFLTKGSIEDLDATFGLAEKLEDSASHAYARARRILEGAPRNLAALFMAMRFSPSEYKFANARDFFQVALTDPKISQDLVARCYESMAEELKPRIFRTLNEVGGKLDNRQGWNWLCNEAQRLSLGQPDFIKMSDALGLRLLIDEVTALNLAKEARRLDQRVGGI